MLASVVHDSDTSGSVCTAVLCRPQICIIPKSAHGTNPASAIMAGMKIVAISTDAKGNIDIEELRQKAEQHADKWVACSLDASLMTACQPGLKPLSKAERCPCKPEKTLKTLLCTSVM
jgi:hypothetical protein